MILNDVKVAFRNMRKFRFFSALNIIGLALSMSVSLIIITVIRNQYGYDQFHPAPERTFRVITEALRKEGGTEKYASSPFPVGTAIARDFAVAEEVVALSFGPGGDALLDDGRTLPIRSYYADGAFFKVFGFHLEAGNEADALSEPFSIILTKATATRLFGDQDPLNKTLDINGYGKFKVTGVLQKVDRKTHLDFQALTSSSTMVSLEKQQAPEDQESLVRENWTNYYRTYNYVLLNPGKTKTDLETALSEIASTRYKGLALESRDAGYRFLAQNLGNITPADMILSQTMENSMPVFVIWGLIGFVILLTVFPCLNYANLTIARALVRAKEVGIRKVMGARRSELIRQFLTEAVLTALLALALAWFLRIPLLQLLDGIVPDADANLYNPFLEDWKTYLMFAGFTLVVGLGAGWVPAFYMSRFRPDAALRDLSRLKLFARLNLRKALIVMQFTISMIFLIVVATVWKQLDFAMLTNYGFDKEHIVNIQLGAVDREALAAEIARDHRVVQVSASSHTIGTWEDWSVDVRRNRADAPSPTRNFFIDQHYIANHGLTLIAGSDFPADLNPDRQQFVILNEKALEKFDLGSPKDAIGQTLWLDDTTEVAVLGVLKDFHFRPLTYEIGPLLLLYAPRHFTQLDVRLTPGDPAGALASMEGIWKKFDPIHPMRYAFLDQKMRDCYQEMRNIAGMLGFFALLAISIACLGLLGIVTFSVETRSKEISIRKVIGASVTDLTLLLSRNFLVLLGLAMAIAIPTGYFLANLLLQTFAYRITVGFGIVGGCVLSLLALALAAVGWQTIRAALSNPVEKLRGE